MNNQDNNNFNDIYGQGNNDYFNNGMSQSSQQPQDYDFQNQQFSNQGKPNLYAADPYMEQINQQSVEQVEEDDNRGGGLFSFLFALLLLIVSVAFLLNTLNIIDLKELANKYIPIGNKSEKKDEVDSYDKNDNNVDDSKVENNSSDNKLDSNKEYHNNDEVIENNENNVVE